MFKLPEESKWDRFRKTVEDSNFRLKKLGGEIEKITGSSIDENYDLWSQKDMLSRKSADAVRRIRDKKIVLVQQIIDDGLTIDYVDSYLHALHAKERNARMNAYRIEKGQDPIDGLSGMTDKEADKILESATPEVKKYRGIIKKVIDETLQFQLDEGLINQEAVDKIKSAYNNYIPLFRDLDSDGGFTGIGTGVDIRGKEIKRAKGSTKRVTSPIANVFAFKEKVVIRSLKNKIGLTIKDLVNEYPELKDLFVIESQQYIPRYDSDGELRFLDPKMKLGDNVIGFKEEGKQKFITVKDKALAEALKNTNMARTGSLLKYLKLGISIWSRFKTQLRPEFLVTNFERDLGEALINLGVESKQLNVKGLRKEVLKELFKSQADIWKYVRGDETNPVTDRFFELGGDVGHFWAENAIGAERSIQSLERELRNQGMTKILNLGRKLDKLITDINTMVELGVRLSAFKALTKKGMSEERAIQSTSDLTVNFSRQGTLSPVLKALYGFINPAIQGTSKVFRALASKQGGKYYGAKVAQAVAGLIALGFIVRMLSIMLDREGDKRMGNWMKSHKLAFPNGRGGQIVLWNMPYGYSTFYSAGSNLAEVLMGIKTPREGLVDVIDTGINSFSPWGTNLNDFIPTLAKPIFEINQNKNWYGGAIYPSQMFTRTPQPDFKTYFDKASEPSKFIAEFLSGITGGNKDYAGLIDIHPNSIDYLFSQYAGGPFEFVMDSISSAMDVAKGEYDPNKTPFVRQFYRNEKPSQWSYGMIYDTLERVGKYKISDLEEKRFYDAVETGLEFNIYDEDTAQGYIRDFIKAKYKIVGRIGSEETAEKLASLSKEDLEKIFKAYSKRTIKTIKKSITRYKLKKGL